MSSDTNTTGDEALLVSLFSAFNEANDNPQGVILYYNGEPGTTDEHVINGDYFNITSKNQIKITTEYTGSDPACHHTLIDGVCVFELNDTVQNLSGLIESVRGNLTTISGYVNKNTQDITELKDAFDKANKAVTVTKFENNWAYSSDEKITINGSSIFYISVTSGATPATMKFQYNAQPDGNVVEKYTFVVDAKSVAANRTYYIQFAEDYRFALNIESGHIYHFVVTYSNKASSAFTVQKILAK